MAALPTKRLSGTQLAIGALVALALVALLWPVDESVDAGWPREAPLLDEKGLTRPLADEVRGPTLVHLWASWCLPCRDEIPALLRLEADLSRNGDSNPRILFVAVADQLPAARRLYGDGPLWLDPDWKVAHGFATRQLPETHLVVDGERRHSWQGATAWDDPEVRRQLARLTSTSPIEAARGAR